MNINDVTCNNLVSANTTIIWSKKIPNGLNMFICWKINLQMITLEVLESHFVASQEDDRQNPKECTLVQFRTMALRLHISGRLHCKLCDDLYPKVFRRTCRFRTLPKCDFHHGMDLGKWRLDASKYRNFHPTLDRWMNHHSSRLGDLYRIVIKINRKSATRFLYCKLSLIIK